MKENSAKGWYSRGYLPHFDDTSRTQFITYRLAYSLPQKVLRRFQILLEHGEITDRELLIRVDKYLDQGIGECYLRDPEIAEMVEANLRNFDGKKYTLHAWVIMPNHIHLLLTPKDGHTLSEITHSAKSYTANCSNEILKREGRFWFPEVFDRFIRDQDHFEKTWRYIEMNPVKANLCAKSFEWRFSSSWWRSQKNT